MDGEVVRWSDGWRDVGKVGWDVGGFRDGKMEVDVDRLVLEKIEGEGKNVNNKKKK